MAVPPLEPWRWCLGVVCAIGVGVAKTGVPGLGILVVPLMVHAVGDARQSAGWLLPMLCSADILAVAIYRRHAQARRLFSLLPWVLVGMAAGAVTLAGPESVLRRVVGAIVLAMVALQIWRKREASVPATVTPANRGGSASVDAQADAHESVGRAAAYGVIAGFATMVANAAGPVMNMYLLAKRLAKQEFIATGAWFFLVINLTKLPVYAAHGLISGGSLTFDLLLLPGVLAGGWLGRAISKRIPQKAFEAVILCLTALAALLLLAPSLRL